MDVNNERIVVRAGPPLVSIVTPSYNQGRFLRRAIDSVLRQSYPHIEYVVVDGGSTDESVAVLKSYGNRLAWVSEPDRGQAHAINKGFARASGAVRAYINSDDFYNPGTLHAVGEHFRDNPATAEAVGRGYTAVKLHEHLVETVAPGRDAAGRNIALMVDTNCA